MTLSLSNQRPDHRPSSHSNRRTAIAAIAIMATVASVAGLASTQASAQAVTAAQIASWPNRPIRLIVPFPAGSFTDSVGRIMSEGLAKQLGQPVVVENRAGANGVLGLTEASRAAADGYTLVVTNSSSVTINPQIYKKLSYKASDLTPITTIVEAPFILVANPEWAQKNRINAVKDIVEFARSNPGQLSYGSAGAGNIAHLSYAMLGNRSQTKMTHVPYRSAAAAQLAVLGGEIHTSFDTWTALPHIRAGKLKALAVSSNKRMVQLPDVPTVEQAGIADFNATFWIGILAPAGTPPQILQRVFAAAERVMDEPRARAALATQGDIALVDPTAFARRITRETAAWGSVIKREAITLD